MTLWVAIPILAFCVTYLTVSYYREWKFDRDVRKAGSRSSQSVDDTADR